MSELSEPGGRGPRGPLHFLASPILAQLYSFCGTHSSRPICTRLSAADRTSVWAPRPQRRPRSPRHACVGLFAHQGAAPSLQRLPRRQTATKGWGFRSSHSLPNHHLREQVLNMTAKDIIPHQAPSRLQRLRYTYAVLCSCRARVCEDGTACATLRGRRCVRVILESARTALCACHVLDAARRRPRVPVHHTRSLARPLLCSRHLRRHRRRGDNAVSEAGVTEITPSSSVLLCARRRPFIQEIVQFYGRCGAKLTTSRFGAFRL